MSYFVDIPKGWKYMTIHHPKAGHGHYHLNASSPPVDKNNDGLIDREELRQIMAAVIGKEPSIEQVRQRGSRGLIRTPGGSGSIGGGGGRGLSRRHSRCDERFLTDSSVAD